jgi:GNAT superfamily N-acetyltransferase
MARTNEQPDGTQELTGWEVHPLTPDRWHDLEKLFGERGAYSGCWCMWWRISGQQFFAQRGQQNKESFKQVVESGEVPGILGYADGEPVGWCAIAPRNAHMRLREERVRIFKKVDDQPVWTITCFFVARPFRHRGVMPRLLEGAIEYAASEGAKIIEGYPLDPQFKPVATNSAYTGILGVFQKAGFVEVLRRHEGRPIMRYFVEGIEVREANNAGSV